MASGHTRKPSGRVLLRRATKGPLDAPDELTIDTTSPTLPIRSGDTSPIKGFSPARSPIPDSAFVSLGKDMSFILDSTIYHPLSQLEIPTPFRIPFPTVAKEDSLDKCLETLEEILSKGQFLQAAHYAAILLTTGKVKPADLSLIFYLLQVRYSCLELSGNTMLAAQEAKALEDLNSNFYFVPTGGETPIDGERVEQHIMPYPLRLQALRLQALGFGDPRRGVSTLYDLGLECREQIALVSTSDEDRLLWRKRLADLGIRVVNALVEMGDLDAAKRTLLTQLPKKEVSDTKMDTEMLTRLTLLMLKIGDTDSARKLLDSHSSGNEGILEALLSVSEGKWEDAVKQWESLLEDSGVQLDQAIIRQNLAVALLYVGRLPEARKVMEEMVNSGYGFQSLTFNLATLYDLSSANAYASKKQLAVRIAQHPGSAGEPWGRSNIDFKL